MIRFFARFGCLYFGHIRILDHYDSATHEATIICLRCHPRRRGIVHTTVRSP